VLCGLRVSEEFKRETLAPLHSDTNTPAPKHGVSECVCHAHTPSPARKRSSSARGQTWNKRNEEEKQNLLPCVVGRCFNSVSPLSNEDGSTRRAAEQRNTAKNANSGGVERKQENSRKKPKRKRSFWREVGIFSFVLTGGCSHREKKKQQLQLIHVKSRQRESFRAEKERRK